jgi:Nickel/cobalt transporter regulator
MKSLMIALMAAVMAWPVAALADDHGRHGGHGGGGGGHFGGPGGGFGGPAPRGGPPPGYGGGGPRFAPPPYARPPGYGPPAGYGGPRYREGFEDFGHAGPGRFRRGQFLPPTERGYVVGDYYRYHLRRPPPGYYWYRSGSDFVLAATASGLIFEVVAGDGY